jgi:hypothetical protein
MHFFIFGYDGNTFSFVADQALPVYWVELADLDWPGPFDILAVAITTSTEYITEFLAPGETTFDVDLGTTYFAHVLGLADDDFRAGLFGIKITSDPNPPSLILLGSSVLGLVLLRRRVR